MKQELQQQLYGKYPELFVQKDWDKSKTCMVWGISTGDGWQGLIDKTCADIMAYCKLNNKEPPQFVQVKEKFAGLRMYLSTYDDWLRDILEESAAKSYWICEECGKDGKVRLDRQWIIPLCAECHKKDERYGSLLRSDEEIDSILRGIGFDDADMEKWRAM